MLHQIRFMGRGIFLWLAMLAGLGVIEPGTMQGQSDLFQSGAVEQVTATMKAAVKTAAPGDAFDVTVQLRIAKGFHIYGDSGTNSPFIVTSLNLTLPKGLETNGNWIAPRPIRDKDGAMIYTNAIVFRRALRVKADAPLKTLNVAVELHYQACDEKMCFPPETLELEAPILIAEKTNSPPTVK